MSAPKIESVKTRLENVIALARLLERVERSPKAPDAEQYRALIRQLGTALEGDLPHDALQAVLGAHPATAELYENLHYEKSGLSRSPLERSIGTEMATSQALHRIAQGARNTPKA
ncbi:MAG: hypothetical protein ABIV63_13345 [Caldimonas sp.]